MDALQWLKEVLPSGLVCVLNTYPDTEELHLRAGSAACVTAGNCNTVCDYVTDGAELHRIFVALCRGSVHAHEHTMRLGYVCAGEGIRVGVAGELYEGTDHAALRRVTSLNIRIPHKVRVDGGDIAALAVRSQAGILLYGLPGCGKTTLLRDIISRLCLPPYSRRVTVVDTRGELCTGVPQSGVCDVLQGYPKSAGIEIATRALDPQFIVCDEIGTMQDARSIIDVQNAGVPLIASAHGADLASLMRRPGIRALFAEGVFAHAVRVYRCDGQFCHEVQTVPISEVKT